MTSRRRRIPKYRHFKPRDLGVVRINGHDHYLGKYNSEESWERYHRLISEWLKNGRVLPEQAVDPVALPSSGISVNELILGYYRFAKGYYVKDGETTDEIHGIRAAMRALRQLYGHTPAVNFGPRALKNVRQAMIEANLSRTYINANVDRIRRAFRWASSEELISVSVYEALRTVTSLSKGKSAARETSKVKPVPLPHVEAVLPYLTKQLAAMVKLQLVTGARPGEISNLRPV